MVQGEDFEVASVGVLGLLAGELDVGEFAVGQQQFGVLRRYAAGALLQVPVGVGLVGFRKAYPEHHLHIVGVVVVEEHRHGCGVHHFFGGVVGKQGVVGAGGGLLSVMACGYKGRGRNCQ